MNINFYEYWRSSAAYRVRIALKMKNVPYTSVPIHLANGEQLKEAYRNKNPMTAVPMLEVGNMQLGQSLAIIEYLEEIYPMPSLMPVTPEQRAAARSMALLITADIHPLNNLRVVKYLKEIFKVKDEAKDTWYSHWITEGLKAYEKLAKQHGNGQFSVGDAPSIADLCLIPQCYNARRFNVPLDDFPTILAIDANCSALPAFQAAHPSKQPGAE